MDNINIFNNSAIIRSKKTPKSIISWITILIVFFLVLIILFNIPFNVYKNYIGTVLDNGNVEIVLEDSDFPFNKKDKLYIKNNKYNYNVIYIEENVLIMDIDINKGLKIKGNIFKINIRKGKNTVFKILVSKIKKGLIK